MTEELEEYILRHIDKEGETLSRLDRETAEDVRKNDPP